MRQKQSLYLSHKYNFLIIYIILKTQQYNIQFDKKNNELLKEGDVILMKTATSFKAN